MYMRRDADALNMQLHLPFSLHRLTCKKSDGMVLLSILILLRVRVTSRVPNHNSIFYILMSAQLKIKRVKTET